MKSPRSIDDIVALYAARGGLHYGEGVTQTEHAVQCATLAQAQGAAPALVLAALLHDIGHLLTVTEEADAFDFDDRHETIGAAALGDLFDKAVRAPIALHVAAKRYLCYREPSYAASLSHASQMSLALQGGPFDHAGATAFENLSYSSEAVTVRRLDDMGKRTDCAHRDFSAFVPLMRSLSVLPGGGLQGA